MREASTGKKTLGKKGGEKRMKRLIAVIITVVFVLGFAVLGFAADADKCGSCHKGDKALDKIVKSKNIAGCDALMKGVKEGKAAKMHEKLTADDYKAACKTLNLK
jgi:hypothetical protein